MLGSKPACTKDPSYMPACCTLNHTERPPDDVVRKFGEESPEAVEERSLNARIPEIGVLTAITGPYPAEGSTDRYW
ncbi:hypothetical protein AVEN_170691-1 [Araneus ventricosus]|uniref:Uncharacterized protein n=1 Tax=Araneus ventricosus TaxID=182803 RepID=A0A4Y2K1C5_ARAVE|nr:hypothetical protein AVEN_170691-1 [Araneus ventricosus]